MNPFQIIATLRKFGNFLVGLFPWLGKVAEFFARKFAALLALLMTVSLVSKLVNYLNDRAWVKGIKSVFKRFYWRDYSKDKLSLDDLPADSVAILRPVFLISTFLCLLMPLLMVPAFSVPIETFSGIKSNVPLWSVLLWFASAVIAWSALLVGTAVANRLAFLLGGVAYAYLCGSVVACCEKSPTNVFIPLTILFAVFLHEKSCKAPGKLNAIYGAAIAALLGAGAGIYFFAATTIKMPPTVSSLWISLPSGACLGLLVFCLARLKAVENNRWRQFIAADIPLPLAFQIVADMLSANFVFLCFRGGLSKVAGHLISLTHLTESYAWPVWYLLAVGIIMKLIKNSDVVAKATSDVVGLKLLRPTTFILVSACLATVYCESALSWFTPGSPFYFLSDAAQHVYMLTRGWFWKEPIFAFSAPYIGPILIFDLICMVWLIAHRRFSEDIGGRLLYLTILAWFVISEYSFEVLSLGRSPSHSIVALMLFSIWLLWLMHTIGLGLSTRSSPLWPSRSRLPIYGSVLIFALLEIHSRGAMQDFKVTNELFLIMERGIIDVGLPYFLWVYVSRRLTDLPLGVATVFCLFCAGALIALPINMLDKLSVCQWDWNQFVQLTQALTQKYMATGNLQYEATLHYGWLIAKSAIFCALLWVTAGVSWHFYKNRTQWAMIVSFVLVTVASGIASFSKGFLDLGLPAFFAVATAPLSLDLLLSPRVVVIYLAAWIPALLLSISLVKLASKPSAGNFSLKNLLAYTSPYLLVGFILSTVLRVLFYCCEDFLQSCSALLPLLSLFGLLFVLLVARLVSSGEVPATGVQATTAEIKDRRDLRRLIFAATVASFIWCAYNSVVALTSIRQVDSVQKQLRVPVEFASATNGESAQNKTTSFTNSRVGFDKSFLIVGKVASDGLDTKTLLAHLLDKASQSGQFNDLKIVRIESWQDRYPGALACSYAYNTFYKQGTNFTTFPMTGITVLLPTEDTRSVDFVTIFTPPAELELRRFQAAWLTDQLAATTKTSAAASAPRP